MRDMDYIIEVLKRWMIEQNVALLKTWTVIPSTSSGGTLRRKKACPELAVALSAVEGVAEGPKNLNS